MKKTVKCLDCGDEFTVNMPCENCTQFCDQAAYDYPICTDCKLSWKCGHCKE